MDIYDMLPKLIRAGINEDKKSLESISLGISRMIKKSNPETANEISKIIACSNMGASVSRSMDMKPVPVDRDTRSSLMKIEEPYQILEPILNMEIKNQLLDFIKEREKIEEFLREDIVPPNGLLLSGKPGVGKTYIAKWLSYKLNLPLATLDLATSISSYLGRSGQNIKSIFNYAKSQNIILFLDELDAIAKRRDDMGDLGELKRLVNVLLKELEDLPVTCVVIGATNHPELLDNAIWRRFDRNIEIDLPGQRERQELIQRSMGKKYSDISDRTIEFVVKNTDGLSAADVCKMCEHIKRQMIISEEKSIDICAIKESCRFINISDKSEKKKICKLLKKELPKITLRDMEKITGVSIATISRYLKE